MRENPFDSIESAHQYVSLLKQQVQEVKEHLIEDLDVASGNHESRRLDAVRLVEYKLTQLADHLAASARILNDLRALRRLLLAERETVAEVGDDPAVVPATQTRAPSPDPPGQATVRL